MLAPKGFISAPEAYMRAWEAVMTVAWPLPLPLPVPQHSNPIAQSNVYHRRKHEFCRSLSNALFHEFLEAHRFELHVWDHHGDVLRVQQQILTLVEDEALPMLRDVPFDDLFPTIMASAFARPRRYFFLDESRWAVTAPSQEQIAYRAAHDHAHATDVDAARKIEGYRLFLPDKIDWSVTRFKSHLPAQNWSTDDARRPTTSGQIQNAKRELTRHLTQLKEIDARLPPKAALFHWYQDRSGVALTKTAKGYVWTYLKLDFPELARPGRPRKASETFPPQI